MSIRLAAAQPIARLRLEPLLLQRMQIICANDNSPLVSQSGDILHAALRHFAAHGLAAAQKAKGEALTAHRAGDEAGFQCWRSICHVLDRRLAETLAHRKDGRERTNMMH